MMHSTLPDAQTQKMRIHFIGIGGSGLSAIARLLLESGYTVTGSDRLLSPLAQELAAEGVHVRAGHSPENVQGADIVVRSSAIPDDNVEVQAAMASGIPVLKRAQFLGRLMENHLGIAVAGTAGKTTTTSMIAWLLVRLGLDPSYIIGGTAKNLGGKNGHAGQGHAFVIEADEYDRMFLGLSPDIIVVNNLEYDHPDCFPTPENYYAAFVEFAHRLQPGGILITAYDNTESRRLVADAPQNARVFTFGTDAAADYTAENLTVNSQGGFDYQAFFRPTQGEKIALAQVSLQVPGEHNLRNSLAALAVIHQILPSDQAADLLPQAALALSEYTGAGRRFDIIGEANGITVVDDYAHHPAKIQATLAAARARYPQRRIWAVWQPHTYSRTRTLLTDFTHAFADADRVIVTEVYAAREKAQDFDDFSAVQVVYQMQHPSVQFIPTLDEVSRYLLQHLQPGDVLLVLSAGDADQVSAQVLAGLRQQKTPAAAAASSFSISALRKVFGDALQENASLAAYTTAHVGGPADALLVVKSTSELEQAALRLWEMDIPFKIFGYGSNVLVSDSGVRGVVIVNRARAMIIDPNGSSPSVWAESGAMIGTIARQVALKGLGGFEWAATVPGTLGGAIYGNAGAFGGDIHSSLLLAEILHPTGKELWPVERLQYQYRSSLLKREHIPAVILAARIKLERSSPQNVQEKMEKYSDHRRHTQPPGASMGSMFKNPTGDYAGRLIEAAGLKGKQVGDAEISSIHANFFINHGKATSADIGELIRTARETVAEKFGVQLALEVELLGDWPTLLDPAIHENRKGASQNHDR